MRTDVEAVRDWLDRDRAEGRDIRVGPDDWEGQRVLWRGDDLDRVIASMPDDEDGA